jgi:hypothetical protein
LRRKIYEVAAEEKRIPILFTFHSLERIARWRLTERTVLQALLFPEEVVRGHRNRYIAHRRSRGHVVRAVYEYEGKMPAVITVYYPAAGRYFRGGGIYEDKILS